MIPYSLKWKFGKRYRLNFSPKFVPAILKGIKTQTIRDWDSLYLTSVGDIVYLNHTPIKLEITSIKKMALKNIGVKEMKKECLTLYQFKKIFSDIYGHYERDKEVFIIQFKLLKED